MAAKYIIYAPAYSKNNGVRALYRLHDQLRTQGCEAYIFCLGEHIGDYHYLEKISSHMRGNDIVVYPEITVGNPLQFKRVVRWVLFYPGENGGTRTYHSSEMIFTWIPNYYAAPELRFPMLDSSLFFDANRPKTQDCYFIHKGGKWKDIKEIDGLLEINMQFPPMRKHLAELLQTTGTLYSFDRHSILNLEAKVCGARVRMVTDDGFFDYEDPGEDPAVFDRQLISFIDLTKNKAPAGRIERLSFQERWKIARRSFLLILYLRLSAVCGAPVLAKKIKDYRRYLKEYGCPRIWRARFLL